MTGGAQSEPNGQPIEPRPPDQRVWQHPSEVGLATRGRTDRRRSTLVAAGVILSGIGILVTGVLIGSADGPEPDGEPVAPMDKVSTSVAHVTVEVVGNDMPTMVTGLVLDEDGNLLVPADAVAQGEEIWARCADGETERVQVVGTDAETNLAVLRVAMPAGSPAVTSTVAPTAGAEVVTVHARSGTDLAMRDGVVADTDPSPPGSATATSADLPFWAEVDNRAVNGPAKDATDLSGGLVFDRGGRFVGMTTGPDDTASGGAAPSTTAPATTGRRSMVRVMPAEEALRSADRILAGA